MSKNGKSETGSRAAIIKNDYERARKDIKFTIFNIHVIRPYMPSNQNRDDSGHIKTLTWGNSVRLYRSSQNRKFSVRHSDLIRELKISDIEPKSTQTRLILSKIWEELSVNSKYQKIEERKTLLRNLLVLKCYFDGKDEKTTVSAIKPGVFSKAASMDDILSDAYPKVKNKKESNSDNDSDESSKSSQDSVKISGDSISDVLKTVVTRFSAEEQKLLRDVAETDFTEEEDAKFVKEVFAKITAGMLLVKVTADQAFFGRFYPAISAAISVGPAFTTTSVPKVDMDYFIASDELEEGRAAGFIQNREFSSGVEYAHATVAIPTLRDILGLDVSNTKKMLACIVSLFANESSNSFVNTFAHKTHASWVGVSFSNRPENYSDAFLVPVDQRYPDINNPNLCDLSVRAFFEQVTKNHRFSSGSHFGALREEFISAPSVEGVKTVGKVFNGLGDLMKCVEEFDI